MARLPRTVLIGLPPCSTSWKEWNNRIKENISNIIIYFLFSNSPWMFRGWPLPLGKVLQRHPIPLNVGCIRFIKGFLLRQTLPLLCFIFCVDFIHQTSFPIFALSQHCCLELLIKTFPVWQLGASVLSRFHNFISHFKKKPNKPKIPRISCSANWRLKKVQ